MHNRILLCVLMCQRSTEKNFQQLWITQLTNLELITNASLFTAVLFTWTNKTALEILFTKVIFIVQAFNKSSIKKCLSQTISESSRYTRAQGADERKLKTLPHTSIRPLANVVVPIEGQIAPSLSLRPSETT